jgi:23S rRNA (cytosine1962-C5)-methyltransferase
VRAIVDWYEGHLVVAEYAREQTALLDDYVEQLALAAAQALGVPEANVHTKQRRTRPKTGDRYQRLNKSGERIVVREGDLRFYCNLDDFLDTGLFADHRLTRARVRQEAKGKRVLNLFSYTGSFSVYAASGGATKVTTVDASRTYLEWAEDNFALNRLPAGRHAFVKDDVREFLHFEAQRRHHYELIVCDPPSFSTGRDKGAFDVQRDHPTLVAECLDLLAPGGVLYFSTNHQRFEPQWESVQDDGEITEITEITKETVPEDYRNKQVHRCFRIVKK